MRIPLLSHREEIFRRSETINNHAKTTVSIQAVSQLLESQYQSRGESLTESRRKSISKIWDYLDSSELTDIIKAGITARSRYNTQNYVKLYGKALTTPSDIIMFAKQHGHLATGTTISQKEIQIEVTVPPKPEIIQSDRMKSQEDIHNWIQNICSKSEIPAELYKQLPSKNWLRLLVIEPGSATDVLQCQLLQMELELARSRYEALSYCWRNHLDTRDWGIFWKKDASKFGKLICNGFQVQISPNLGEALHHIRHPRLRRVIWVDALCINQNNEEERSQQVSIMDSIYSNALKTLIWVGNDGNAEKGLGRICQIVNSWDPRKPANFSLFDPKTGKTHFRKPTAATVENISEVKLMQALHEVFGYDWFHRRGVGQEVVLAKSADLLIGHFIIRLLTKYAPTLSKMTGYALTI